MQYLILETAIKGKKTYPHLTEGKLRPKEVNLPTVLSTPNVIESLHFKADIGFILPLFPSFFIQWGVWFAN